MILEHVPLKGYSNYAIGGVARYFCHADGLVALTHAARFAADKKIPIFILGGGTNVLFADGTFKGLVVKPDIRFIGVVDALPETVALSVGAGTSVHELLELCAERGFSGLEWAGGLPGTVGGAIRGNAGAFGGEIKDSVVDVSSADISGLTPVIAKRGVRECAFGYRDSAFKNSAKGEVILSATFSLVRSVPQAVRSAILEKVAWRAARQPLDYPNVGSIFKNVAWESVPDALRGDHELARHVKTDPFPVLPAALLIDRAGMKGVSCGGAMVSQKHPNFIVNACDAEALHVRKLIDLVKHEVHAKFGVTLEEEVESVPELPGTPRRRTI